MRESEFASCCATIEEKIFIFVGLKTRTGRIKLFNLLDGSFGGLKEMKNLIQRLQVDRQEHNSELISRTKNFIYEYPYIDSYLLASMIT